MRSLCLVISSRSDLDPIDTIFTDPCFGQYQVAWNWLHCERVKKVKLWKFKLKDCQVNTFIYYVRLWPITFPHLRNASQWLRKLRLERPLQPQHSGDCILTCTHSLWRCLFPLLAQAAIILALLFCFVRSFASSDLPAEATIALALCLCDVRFAIALALCLCFVSSFASSDLPAWAAILLALGDDHHFASHITLFFSCTYRCVGK